MSGGEEEFPPILHTPDPVLKKFRTETGDTEMTLRNLQTLCRSRRLGAVLPPPTGMIDECHKNNRTATWVSGLDRSGLLIVHASPVMAAEDRSTHYTKLALNWLQRR